MRTRFPFVVLATLISQSLDEAVKLPRIRTA